MEDSITSTELMKQSIQMIKLQLEMLKVLLRRIEQMKDIHPGLKKYHINEIQELIISYQDRILTRYLDKVLNNLPSEFKF